MSHAIRALADCIRSKSESIVQTWLERVSERVSLDPRLVFPSESLLDHVPRLVEGVARAIESDDPITVDTPVVAKAQELGRLRFDQGFSAHQILWEYQVLGSVLLNALDSGLEPPAGEVGLQPVRRLYDALTAVQRATMDEFLEHYQNAISEQEDRLRGFNHALTHELRNELGAILGAARMLREPFVVREDHRRDQFVDMVVNNAERIEHLVQNLVELSRVEKDSRRHRNVMLEHAAREAARHLREFAAARDVEIVVDADLPELEVNAAAVELALTNLIANGIKYHDPEKSDRWIRVSRRTSAEPDCVTVEVRDNGRGVPFHARQRLFERYFRAEPDSDVEGTGLGLHLVKRALEGARGTVWAEFPDDGTTVFAFALPARRDEDQAGAESG